MAQPVPPKPTPSANDAGVKTQAKPKAKAAPPPVDEVPGPKPPDEAFWETYSPNGEAPVSGLTSVVFHGLVLGAVIFGATILALFHRSTDAVDLEPVLIGEPGGGGGSTEGVGDVNPGNLTRPPDATEDLTKPEDTKTPLLPTKVEPDLATTKTAAPVFEDDPDGTKMVDQLLAKKPASVNMGPLLKDALVGLAGKGRGGSGSGGGLGTGKGKGEGDGTGDGTGSTRRGRRVLRWTMLFNTSGGDDYLRQLHALGAILGVQDAGGQVRVYRDLRQRPMKGAVEDLKAINRIFWVDDNQDSMVSMAQAMGLDRVPSQIIAFFPVPLEEQLLKTELDYGRPRGRKAEEDIAETKFRISFPGGRVKVEVQEQRGR